MDERKKPEEEDAEGLRLSMAPEDPEDDTEGNAPIHRRPFVEGTEEDDTEGNAPVHRRPSVEGEDDTEGHRRH
jgi:hypothetical protein